MDLRIKTKFCFGDNVWFMHFGKPTRDMVTAIRVDEGMSGLIISYLIIDELGNVYCIPEEFVYKTKKELLANQKM